MSLQVYNNLKLLEDACDFTSYLIIITKLLSEALFGWVFFFLLIKRKHTVTHWSENGLSRFIPWGQRCLYFEPATAYPCFSLFLVIRQGMITLKRTGIMK